MHRIWGDAQNLGFSVLEVIGKLLGSDSTQPGGRILPKLWKDDVDKEVTMLILKVVARLVNCVSSAPTKNEGNFRRILSIVEEIQELGLMGAHADEKLQSDLLTHLSNCVLFLVKELASFGGVLAHEFCLVTFSAFRRLSINDEMEKFGLRICSLLLELLESDNQPASSFGIFTCVLDAMSHEKVNLSPIMCLYNIKQSLNCFNLRGGNSKMLKAGKDISIHKVLLQIDDQLRRSTKIHGSYKLSVENLGSTDKALYFTALKFLCVPISELINSEHKDILCGLEDVSLPNIEDALRQFEDVYLAFSLECSDMLRNLYKDNSQAAVAVASAAFTLSFTTKQNAKELLAYEEHKSLNPKLSETMQAIIKEVLAKDCTAKDRCLQKSRILIANGMESRACGVEGLKDCINYLSKAIANMTDLYNKTKEDRGPICFLLAKACGLRAFCTQEAEPKSEVILKDIEFALNLWSSQHCSQSAESMASRNNLALLYCVSDLISLKGYKVDHSLIYETMINFSSLKDVPLEDCVAFLWKFRRLNHALCASSVNDEFIRKLSEHNSLSKSVKFWDSCMQRSESLKVGLWESLMVISTLSSSHSCVHDHATKTDERIDQVKKFASDLLKRVPLSKTSLFLAAQLYYDLAESMIARGSMIEALSCAKEAHRLRNDLFRKMFIYSMEKEHECLVSADGEEIWIRRFVFQTFHMHSSVATAAWTAWSTMKGSSNFDESEPTPSKILQCYLESILQMGSLEEVRNDGSRAEFFLQLGKGISLSQDLPIFLVSFSAALGNLYRKKQLLDLAEKELQSANGILTDRSSLLSCSNCRPVLEVTVAQQLGDLHRSRFTRNKERNEFSRAENFYKSAENKLNSDGWKNSLSNPDEASARNKIVCAALLSDGNARTSRSEHDQNKVQDDKEKQKVDSIAASVRDKVKCWHCLPYEVRNSSMETVIQMKWECTRRRLLLRILTGKGKCLWVCGEIRRAQDVFFESMSVLLIRNTFHQSHFLTPTPFTFLATLIEDNVTGDIFSVEQALILYNICKFSLKSFNDNDNDTWKHGPVVVSGLKLAFILCHEVPVLLKKVSRLLAVLSIHFSSKKAFSMPSSSSNHLCESQWASYFHQVSLGTDFSLRLFSSAGKQKDQKTTDVNGSCLPSVRRLAPKSVRDLEGFVETFFQGLPHGIIICVSMFGGDFANLLTELFQYESSTPLAWIMLSRFNLDSVPVVVVLPIDGTLAETSVSSLNKKSSLWHCPWGKTIIDDVAPQFREILEDNLISLRSPKAKDPTWQTSRRQELDTRLSGFLSDIERLWFGPCKDLLLGEWLDNKHLNSLQEKLMQDLKAECKVDASESIIKLVLGVSQDASQGVQWLSELILNNGCYVRKNSGKQDRINNLLVSQLISDAIQKIQEEIFSLYQGSILLEGLLFGRSRVDLAQAIQMANTVSNTNNLSLRSILEKDKLTGPNFLDWERNLMIVLRHERKWYVLEEPLGEAPPGNASAAIRNAHKKHSDDLLDVGCLMLATMSPDLQTGLMNTNAYDMIRQLRDMFQTQARTERYDATKAFNECKMIKGTSVSDHVMKMKRHIDHLERLGHPVPLQLATDTILNSLSEDYKPFVINYNMNNMEKSIAELHSMLKTAELNMGTKSKTKDVLMVRDGGVKKKHGHGSTSKGKSPVQTVQSAPKVRKSGKGKGKGKGKKVKPNKARTENRCFTCNEIGHWRQNCPKRHETGGQK